MTNFELIRLRSSVRSYTESDLEPEIIEILEAICMEHVKGPFCSQVRFKIINFGKNYPQKLHKIGTYGVIRGAKHFIAGIIKEGEKTREDLGYCMEKVILETTRLGLGTCWLAGTFKRSAFTRQVGLSPNEYLPAISPVGYSADNLSAAAAIIKFSAGSKKRKLFAELFYQSDGKTALTEEEAGIFRKPLEAVRIGPSALNRQPWRIVKDNQGFFNLYIKESILYKAAASQLNVQRLDIGIAMCHFELVAREEGLDGTWSGIKENPDIPGLKFIARWV